jgi:hypothetical protein
MARKARKAARPKHPQYEQRIVLFLDFLGFKEIVDGTVGSTTNLDVLLSAIDHLYEIGDDKDLYASVCATTFSDSVVLSYAVREQSAVFHLLLDIAYAIIGLVARGFLVRGAVTIGELVHTKKYLVGPAMVRAYEMESKEAKFPRVLLDPGLVEIARQAHADHHDPEDEEGYVRLLMTKDRDKRHFIDYVSWESVVNVAGMEDDNYSDYLRGISSILRRGFDNPNAGVLEKYLWIHKQYISAIKLFEQIKPDDDYRINNPENYEAVVRLPKLKAEAKRARSIVTQAKKR